jgi:hypothetical protein
MAMWRQSIAALAVLTLGSPVVSAVSSSEKNDNTYQWSGELVSMDTSASSLTVKCRVAYPEALSELKQFKPGERVWVVWSGLHEYSDAVRQVRRAELGNKIGEDLVLPAELVSTEAPNSYVTIRIRVPSSSLAALKTVKPGEWVTVTSRHRPSTDAEAVLAVKPYVASASQLSTN